MNSILKFLCFVLFFSFGNDGEVIGQNIQKIEHNGVVREYFVHVPKNYNAKKSIPLVLAFHGSGDTAYMFKYYTGFDKIADAENFIVLYPQGIERRGRTSWSVRTGNDKNNVDDVAFVSALITMMAENYSIDLSRIYATGMSNGGYFSFLLACQLSDKIAAVASVTGAMTPQMRATCKPSRAIPVLQMHGTDDKAVPYLGYPNRSLSIDELMAYWTQINEMDQPARMRKMSDLDKADGSYVERYVYKSRLNNTKVVHYKVIGGEHDWFGVRGNKDINASEIIWDFFSNYELELN